MLQISIPKQHLPLVNISSKLYISMIEIIHTESLVHISALGFEDWKELTCYLQSEH